MNQSDGSAKPVDALAALVKPKRKRHRKDEAAAEPTKRKRTRVSVEVPAQPLFLRTIDWMRSQSVEQVAALRFGLQTLRSQVLACTACSARAEAVDPVPGVGQPRGIVFVGRNPGAEEDLQGAPFVGPSGRKLDWFIEQCGISRSDIFLTNLVLCHTYKDREPDRVEVSTCSKRWLLEYLKLLQPYLVVTFGGQAAELLIGRNRKMKDIHGTVYPHAAGFYVIPSYHPAYILRSPGEEVTWRYDAAQVRRFLLHRREMMERFYDRQSTGDVAGG